MIKKKSNLLLILILIVGLVIIGLSLYEQIKEKELLKEYSKEKPEEPVEIVEEPIKEIIVEEPKPKEIIIYISRYDFDKPNIIIEPGTKVIWENKDERRHIITNKRLGLFREIRKSLEYGDTFEYVFNEPGVYEILEANFGINGEIVVAESSESITGQIITNIEVNSLGFLLIAINLFVITTIALIIGFYFSKRKVHS